MSGDFTLVIPTYNRPRELGALLRHFAAHEVPWKIVVLDSGTEEYVLETTGLDVAFHYYDSSCHPFDKFRQGLQLHVTTEYCALCADDDLYVPSALDACVQALKVNPRAVMATGQSFSYEPGTLKLGPPAHKHESIVDAAPFMRFARLFTRYHALTYGVYRTAALEQVLIKATAVPSILARELLASALTAIEGEIIYLPQFAHGRSSGAPAQRYHNCHPTIWMLEDADEMFAEYVMFRNILTAAVVNADAQEDRHFVKTRLNLMFLSYLEQTANVSFAVESDHIHVKFEDRNTDEGIPEYTPDELAELGRAMRHYKLAQHS